MFPEITQGRAGYQGLQTRTFGVWRLP